jgi:helix-turn-helix protein
MARKSARDVREAPAYTASEAARYLRLPPSTVRAWTFGQAYGRGNKEGAFQPVIKPADREARRLSFLNLIELLVLAAIRRKHAISLPQVRRALRFLERRYPSPHPLADHRFQTNGANLFLRRSKPRLSPPICRTALRRSAC